MTSSSADHLKKLMTVIAAIVKQILQDGKRLIVLGGGNDVASGWPRDGGVFGPQKWIGINVDSHLDVRIAEERNSGTAYRQLLDEGFLLPGYFYEVAYQTHFASPIYYKHLRDLGVHRISLEDTALARTG